MFGQTVGMGLSAPGQLSQGTGVVKAQIASYVLGHGHSMYTSTTESIVTNVAIKTYASLE